MPSSSLNYVGWLWIGILVCLEIEFSFGYHYTISFLNHHPLEKKN